MNVPLERAQLARLWVDKAEGDYRTFQQLMKMDDDGLIEAVCFHIEQCVEKYLKAWLVYLGIEFPKTHDIGKIVELFPPGSNIPLSGPAQELLTDYAWMTRYPGNWEPLTRRQAEEATVLAVKVRAVIRAGFPKDVLA